jgi:putative oxidoreductase
MGTARDLGLLMLRLGVGASCVSHGAQQLFGWFGDGGVDGTAETIDAIGFEPGERNARLSGLLQVGGGALLALGMATGPAGAALTGNMMIASSVYAPNGFVNTSDGYELPATYALVGTALALTGPGRFSVDQMTGGALNRPWMRVLTLISALASAAYLVATRSAVVPEEDDEEGLTLGTRLRG